MKTETKRNRNRYSSKRGFTLIEIMLVIGLMVMLVGLVIFNVDSILSGNEQSAAEMKVKTSFEGPLTSYRIHMGRYPTTAQGLKALVSRPEDDSRGRWRGPYIKSDADLLLDPWGRPLQYRSPGVHNTAGFDLYSLGPDPDNSDDDITNWD